MVVEEKKKEEEEEEDDEVEEEEGRGGGREGSSRQNRRKLARRRLSRSEDGTRCVRSPRNALFCPRKRARGRRRERERIANKEDERDGRRERFYHVIRGSGGIAGSRR